MCSRNAKTLSYFLLQIKQVNFNKILRWHSS